MYLSSQWGYSVSFATVLCSGRLELLASVHGKSSGNITEECAFGKFSHAEAADSVNDFSRKKHDLMSFFAFTCSRFKKRSACLDLRDLHSKYPTDAFTYN